MKKTLLLMMIVLCVPFVVADMPFWNMTDSSLLLYLAFEDNITDLYSFGYGWADYYNGGKDVLGQYYPSGSFLNSTTGKIGLGVSVNDTGRINKNWTTTAPYNYEFDNFSICFWFYYKNWTPSDNTRQYRLFSMDTLPTGIEEVSFYFQNSTGKNQLHFDVTFDTDDDLFPDVWRLVKDNATGLSEGAYSHVCGIKEGNMTYLYMDMFNLTNITVSHSGSINVPENFSVMTVGSTNPSIKNSFYGNVDELVIYDRALSNAEVVDLFNDGYGWTWMGDTSLAESYESVTYENYNSDFSLYVLHDNLTNVSAALYWNGTPLTASRSSVSFNASHLNTSFVVTHVAPSISGLSQNFEFYWNVSFGYDWQPDNTLLMPTHNQTVTRILVDDCTNGTVSIANFTFFNENTPSSKLVASVDVVVTYWLTNSSLTTVYNDSWSGANNYDFCLAGDTNISADVYLKYNTTNGFFHRYYLFNHSFDNVTDQFSLYNMANTTSISDLNLVARNEANYQFYPNVLGKLQRYYPSENLWRTVQHDLSGDFGNLFFHVREQDTDYRLVFTDTSNHVLKTTNSLKFLCSGGLCENIVLLNPYDGSSTSDNLDVSYSFNNATKVLNVSWVNNIGGTSTINYRVTQEKMGSQIDLCSGTQTGASGSLSCNLSSVEGLVYVSVDGDGEAQFASFISVAAQKLFDVLSKTESAFWSFGIMVTIMMTGLLSPALVVITTLFGLISIFFIGSFSAFSYAFIVVAGAMGIVIALKVRA